MPFGESVPRQKTKALRHPAPAAPGLLHVHSLPSPSGCRPKGDRAPPPHPDPARRAPPLLPAPSGPGGLISLAGGSGSNPAIPKLSRSFGHSLLGSGRLALSSVLLLGPVSPGSPPLRSVSPRVGPGSRLCETRGSGASSPACSWLPGD